MKGLKNIQSLNEFRNFNFCDEYFEEFYIEIDDLILCLMLNALQKNTDNTKIPNLWNYSIHDKTI